MLTEGGVVEARTSSNIKYWGTENAQKRYIRMLACSGSRERLEALHDDLRAASDRLDHLRVLAPVREFLRYTLSREGQADVARDNGYLPLSDGVLTAQMELLR